MNCGIVVAREEQDRRKDCWSPNVCSVNETIRLQGAGGIDSRGRNAVDEGFFHLADCQRFVCLDCYSKETYVAV